MTAHQDVAGVVESLPERLRTNTCRYGYESETEAAKRRIATDLEAASLIEFLESRLAEAMKVIEPFAAMPGCYEMHEDDVIYKNAGAALTAGDFRAARRFLNAGKE